MPVSLKKNSQNGQILLVVVLAAVISLTVGLSAVSRTITNTRVSTEEANSQKALSAAEAGVEELLDKTSPVGGTGIKSLPNQSKFNAVTTVLSGPTILVDNGQNIKKDEGADVWLSDHPTFSKPIDTRLTIYWTDKEGSADCSEDPAIEIAVISGDRVDPTMNRYAVDPCDARRSAQNNFENATGGSATILGKQFDHSFVYPPVGQPQIDNGYIARILPIYADTTLAVESTTPLPAQGYVINSTGTSGETVRKVRVFQGFARLPVEFFPFNLFLP